MRFHHVSVLVMGVACVLPAAVRSAVQSGPDLTSVWQSAELLAPAPKPNQRTAIEAIFTVRNEGDQSAPASRASLYLRPNLARVNVRDPRVSRFLTSVDVPALLPGQQWNGRVAYGLEPGLDAAGLRLTLVVNSSGFVPDSNARNNESTSAPIAPIGAAAAR